MPKSYHYFGYCLKPRCPLKRGGFRRGRDDSGRQQRAAHHCRVGCEKANQQMRRSSHKPPVYVRKMWTRRRLIDQFPLGPSLCCGFLICHGMLLFYLLHRGGLQVCLLRSSGLLLCPGGLRSHLLRPAGFQSRLLHPGGHQVRRLLPGGLQSRRLRPGFLLCLGPRSLRFHRDLALHPSPCSASAPPPSWIIRLCGASGSHSLGGGALSRIWSALLFILHQRSLIILTFTPCITLDFISHHSLH